MIPIIAGDYTRVEVKGLLDMVFAIIEFSLAGLYKSTLCTPYTPCTLCSQETAVMITTIHLVRKIFAPQDVAHHRQRIVVYLN